MLTDNLHMILVENDMRIIHILSHLILITTLAIFNNLHLYFTDLDLKKKKNFGIIAFSFTPLYNSHLAIILVFSFSLTVHHHAPNKEIISRLEATTY